MKEEDILNRYKNIKLRKITDDLGENYSNLLNNKLRAEAKYKTKLARLKLEREFLEVMLYKTLEEIKDLEHES